MAQSQSHPSSFLKGLAVAALGGAVTSIGDAKAHNHGMDDVAHIGTMAATGAAVGLATFLLGHLNGQSTKTDDSSGESEGAD